MKTLLHLCINKVAQYIEYIADLGYIPVTIKAQLLNTIRANGDLDSSNLLKLIDEGQHIANLSGCWKVDNSTVEYLLQTCTQLTQVIQQHSFICILTSYAS